MYAKGYFHEWVPKWANVLLLVVMLVPILAINGVYSSTVSEVASDLGCNSEYISFASNGYAIGVSCCFPFVMAVMGHFRTKTVLLIGILLIAVLSLICAFASSAYTIIVCAFFIGFFKMFTNVLLILPVMSLIAPDGNRGKFYSYFYPFSISIGQLSGIFTSLYSYSFNWRYVYLLATLVLLLLALICVVFMHNKYTKHPAPFGNIDLLSVGVFAMAFMVLNYLLTFAKQQGWLTSDGIRAGCIVFIILLTLFVLMQNVRENPITPLSMFKKKNVVHGLIQIMLVGMFLSTASLQSALTTGVWGYDAPTNNELNITLIPGVTAAGILSYLWVLKNWWLKTYILLGFASFTIYCILMYFLVAPVITIEYLFVPGFFKGMGMGILFIGVSLYAYTRLKMNEMLSVVVILLLIRSFLGTAVFGALYSWWIYGLQWQQANNLSINMDGTNFIVNQAGGGMALYGPVQKQAVLDSVKMLFGYISYAGLIVMVYILLHRFKDIDKRKLVQFGQHLREKREQREQEDEKTLPDVAGAAAL